MDIHFPYSSFFHFANHLDECTYDLRQVHQPVSLSVRSLSGSSSPDITTTSPGDVLVDPQRVGQVGLVDLSIL